VFAPKPTYAPELLPGVAEAQDAGDTAETARETARLARAIDRLAAAFSGDQRRDPPGAPAPRRSAPR
jgi:hypothetical protein